MSDAQIVFADTETVTLAPGPDVIWEVGLIARTGHGDDEWRFQLAPNMERADPESLRICRFAERYVVPAGVQALGWSPWQTDEPAVLTYGAAAAAIAGLLHGAHVVGAVTNFDTERLSLFGRAFGGWEADPWHYHLVDVENLAVGWLAGVRHCSGIALVQPGVEDLPALDLTRLDPPWDSDALFAAVGVAPPSEQERHTALGDARSVRAVWDVIMGGRQ